MIIMAYKTDSIDNKGDANNEEERPEIEGVEILLGRSNSKNRIRIKNQERSWSGTLMTRVHTRKKAVSELAWHQTALTSQRKKGKNAHRDKRKIPGLPLSDGLDMT